MDQAPVEQAPVEQAPVEQAPVEQAPGDFPAVLPRERCRATPWPREGARWGGLRGACPGAWGRWEPRVECPVEWGRWEPRVECPVEWA